MQVIPLGKIAVATAGTPVPITGAMILAASGQLPPNGGVAKLEIWPVNGNTGVIHVKGPGGVIIADLPPPANGNATSWRACGPAGGNVIQPPAFSIDVAINNDAAYVTVWID